MTALPSTVDSLLPPSTWKATGATTATGMSV